MADDQEGALIGVQGGGAGVAADRDLDARDLLDLPHEGGAWPILALREGARERTGLILATQGAEVRRLDAMADAEAPAPELRAAA